jgi:hypothetical protein
MSETTTAERAADQARAKTQEAGVQARDRVRDEVDRRSTQAGEQAGSTAQALRQASERLREDGNEPVARGMEQVAERVDSAGSWLREADGDRILRDVEDFGRRNPLAVVAGGVALGFAVSRMLKASSRRRYEEGRQSWSGNGHGERTRVGAPREGWTEAGPTGGTPATRPPAGPPAMTPPAGPPAMTPPAGPPTTSPPPPSTGWREPDATP